MKIVRIVFYISFGFILSSLLLFFFGDSGIRSYRNLIEYQNIIEDNIQDLKKTNRKLLENMEALSSDTEYIALQARELGYFREDERVIRIDGYKPYKHYYKVGKIVKISLNPGQRDWIFKLFGLTIPVILILLAWFNRKRHAHKNPPS